MAVKDATVTLPMWQYENMKQDLVEYERIENALNDFGRFQGNEETSGEMSLTALIDKETLIDFIKSNIVYIDNGYYSRKEAKRINKIQITF